MAPAKKKASKKAPTKKKKVPPQQAPTSPLPESTTTTRKPPRLTQKEKKISKNQTQKRRSQLQKILSLTVNLLQNLPLLNLLHLNQRRNVIFQEEMMQMRKRMLMEIRKKMGPVLLPWFMIFAVVHVVLLLLFVPMEIPLPWLGLRS